MLLTNWKFKFFNLVHYPASSDNALCELCDYKIQKSTLPYEWLGSYDKRNHVGLVSYERFYASLKDCNIRK